MNVSIEDYIASSLCIRKEVSVDRKERVAQIHTEVAQRVCISFPLIQFDSYNVHSCIVPLPNNNKVEYYTLIDHSMLEFAERLLYCLETDQPNLAVVAYRQLRENIAVANSNKAEEEFYKIRCIYVSKQDLQKEIAFLNRDPAEKAFFEEKYTMMLRFHFLHEYAHYLCKNPISTEEGLKMLTDIVVKDFFSRMRSRIKNTKNWINKWALKKELVSFRQEYSNNAGFREELLCDIAAANCLLELSTFMSPKEIIDSIITYLNVQYAIWLAKNPETAFDPGNIIKFRINIFITLADLLNDQEFANVLAVMINRGNRFAKDLDLYCENLDTTKHEQFHENIVKIVLLDKLNSL